MSCPYWFSLVVSILFDLPCFPLNQPLLQRAFMAAPGAGLMCAAVLALSMCVVAYGGELTRIIHQPKNEEMLSLLVLGDWGRRGLYNQSEVANQVSLSLSLPLSISTLFPSLYNYDFLSLQFSLSPEFCPLRLQYIFSLSHSFLSLLSIKFSLLSSAISFVSHCRWEE